MAHQNLENSLRRSPTNYRWATEENYEATTTLVDQFKLIDDRTHKRAGKLPDQAAHTPRRKGEIPEVFPMPDFTNLAPASLHNPRIKQYLALKNNTISNPENLTCIEGFRALSLALQANLEIRSFFVCPQLLRGVEGQALAQSVIATGTPSFTISAKVLASLVSWEGPDGLVALVKLPRFTWQDIPLSAHSALLVLDGLQIPGNIGTIIRCADGAGADAIIITHRKQRLSHPKLVRASMGSLFSFPIIETEADEAISWLKRHQFKIVLTDTDAHLSYRQASYAGRVAVVMGNEHSGISQPWYETQATSVSIPMNGRADSLNVGNAAVLMLYEVLHHQGRLVCS